MEHSHHVSPELIRSVLENSCGNRVHLHVVGVGSFIGRFDQTCRLGLDGRFLCSRASHIVPIELIEEIGIFNEVKERTAPFQLESMLSTLDLPNRTRPAFLETEEMLQLDASSTRLQYSLQDHLPSDIKEKHRFPQLDTSTYTPYGIAKLKLGYHSGISMPIPMRSFMNVEELTAGTVYGFPSLRGQEFFQTPAWFSGPVRLYADLDYLKTNVEVGRLSGGGFSLPLVGGGVSISRAVVVGLQRIYDEIAHRRTEALDKLGEGIDRDCKLIGYTSFPPVTKQDGNQIVLHYGEPARQIEWREIEGQRYAVGVFHVRNVKAKPELMDTEWTHILINPECSKVTLDTLFSNSEPLIIFATKKNEIMRSNFGKSDSYLILRYAEYDPGLLISE